MKRLAPFNLIAAALFLFLLGMRIGQAAPAALSPAAQLPLIRNGAAPTPMPTGITILDQGDNTFVSAALSPAGCVFLSYIDRDTGNRLHVVQDAGDHLIDLKLPPLALAAAAEIARSIPEFEAPGDKQADGALLIRGATLSLYYTSRDDSTGPFKLRRLDMPLPPCQ